MHRGARIVDPEKGNPSHCDKRRFECPWHGWQYRLDGTVASIPWRDDFDPPEVDDVRALSVAVHEYAGWIWIFLDPDQVVDFEEWMGPEILEELSHFSMENWVLHEYRVWDMPCNWKAVVDAFIEVYHLCGAHKESIGEGLAARQTYQWLFERHSMYVVPRTADIEHVLDTEDHIGDAISHYLVFPVNIFNCSKKQLEMFQPIPIDVNTAKYKCWHMILDDPDPEFKAYMAYAFTADPVEETRVVVFEMWADAASLAAHVEHPNFFEMQKLMAQMGIKSGEVAKYRCDLKGAIYDSTPRARADFFDAADVAG